MGSLTTTRVTAPNSIVGAWGMGNAAVADSSAVVVFLLNNTYFMAQDGDPTAPGESCGKDGIEHGTYSWSATTGAFTSSRSPAPYVDSNGCWGLSDVIGLGTVKVSPDRVSRTFNASSETNTTMRLGPAGSTDILPNTIVEFYHAGFNHYFISIDSNEIRDLHRGTHVGPGANRRADVQCLCRPDDGGESRLPLLHPTGLRRFALLLRVATKMQ